MKEQIYRCKMCEWSYRLSELKKDSNYSLCVKCNKKIKVEAREKEERKTTMTLEEFREEHQNTNRHWDFNAFKILCNKCNSQRVEFNSEMEMENGWYGNISVAGLIIIKCHECGNAKELNFSDISK